VTVKSARKRIFFALWPSGKQRRQIDAAIEPHTAVLSGKWTVRDNWHVTLVFIGGFPEQDIPALQAAAGTIQCPGIRLRFDRIDFWKRPRIMCLYSEFVPDQLTELVRSLESAAKPFGFRPEKRAYRAHMTIARKAGFFEPITLAQPVELHWSAFHLIESVSTPAGIQYKPLKQ
jgi:RNA 2',3'-cyclic 3'-phosphodiesterase